MRQTGMVRRVDVLGRIVIPKEVRRSIGVDEGDGLEIFMDGDKVVLQKYIPNMMCAVTGHVSDKNEVLLNGELILSQEGVRLLLTELAKAVKIPC